MQDVIDFVRRFVDQEFEVHQLDTTATTESVVRAAFDKLNRFCAEDQILESNDYLHLRLVDVEAEHRINKHDDLVKRSLFKVERYGTGKKELYRAYLGGTRSGDADEYTETFVIRKQPEPTIVASFRLRPGAEDWERLGGDKKLSLASLGKAVEGVRILAPTDAESLADYTATDWPLLTNDAAPGLRLDGRAHQAAFEALCKSGTPDELRAFLGKQPLTRKQRRSLAHSLVWDVDRPELVEVLAEQSGDLHEVAIVAARQGHAGSLRVVWPYVADVNAKSSMNEDTILTIAARHGQESTVEVAIANGVKLDEGGPAAFFIEKELGEYKEDGNWPLVNAVRLKNARLVQMLLDAGADPNLKTSVPRSILEMAEAVGHQPVIDLLRSRGAGALVHDGLDFFEAAKAGAIARLLELAPTTDLDDVLIWGGQCGHIELIDHAAGRGVDLPQKHLDSALYYAAQNGHPGVVSRLLEIGASANARSPGAGQSALVTAVAASHVEVVRALLTHGARTSTTREVLDESQGPLRLASMLAVGGGKVTVDAQTLHDAVFRGNAEIVQLLLDAGADINHYSKNGGCPLDVAYQCKHRDIIELLKRAGGIRAKDRNGYVKLPAPKPKAKAKPKPKAKAKAKAPATKKPAAKKKKAPAKKRR